MNKKRISFKKLAGLAFLLPALLLATFTSCQDEQDDNLRGGAGNGKEATMTFSVQLPSGSQSGEPGTRALSETDENMVKTIDVLVFKSGAYQYTATAFSASITDLDLRTKKFTVKLVKENGVDLVILTNSNALIKAAYPSGITEGTAQAAIMSNLKNTVSGKYDATSGSSFPGIAMWGEKTGVNITEGLSLSIPVVRMLAKIDVSVGDGAANNFQLHSVRVYNYNTKGAVVPSLATNDWDATEYKAKRPTVPTDAARTLGPLVYGYDSFGGVLGSTEIAANRYCLGEIFMFEAENHSDADHKTPRDVAERACLVIGGKYYPAGLTPAEIAATAITYYRVDFANKTDGVWTHLDLLRNHKYMVNITTVSGPGFPDPSKAFASTPVNIQANILQWNDGSMSTVVFDGQNFLSVEPGEFNFLRDAQGSKNSKNTLAIDTDVPDGWRIEKVVDAADKTTPINWLTVMDGSSGLPGKKFVWLKVEENKTLSERQAIVVVAAGRLRYSVKVTQNLTPDIGLSIINTQTGKPITELVFAAAVGTTPATQQFTVSWVPKAERLLLSTSTVGANASFVFAEGSNVVSNGILLGGTGTKTYTIQPTALTEAELAPPNELRERRMKVDYTVSNGVSLENKTLFLRQLVYNTIADVKEYYMLNGSSYTFPVRSNTAWVISSVSDPNGILSSDITLVGQSGGYNTATGDNIKFKLIADATGDKSGKTATLTFTDPTGKMGNITVIIRGVAGGYAVKQAIGTKEYLTTKYGDKWWMVQNLAEGTTSAEFTGKAYGYDWSGAALGTLTVGTRGSFNGYYYTAAQAQTICPDGWHLPTAAEVTALIAAVNTADRNANPLSKWWCGAQGVNNDAFAGYGHFSGWSAWGDVGCWWYGTGSQYFSGKTSTMNTFTDPNNLWFSVRCVQN